MSQLSFKCEFESLEMQGTVLPVEIHRPNLSLVTTALTSQSVTLDPGKYFVTARLPTGLELYNEVTVGDQPSYLVKLSPDLSEKSPHESQEVQRYMVDAQVFSLDASIIPDTIMSEPLEANENEAQIRIYRGNPLAGTLELETNLNSKVQSKPVPSRGMAELSIIALPQTILQILQPDAPAVNVLLPAPDQGRCTVQLIMPPEGQIKVDVRLVNQMADSLMRYYNNGLVTQASSMTSSGNAGVISEDLLYGKIDDPIAACIGAYILIRLGDLDKLHNWTENLKNFFKWLPDGAAIRAEHLARLGDHKNAMLALRELADRGLPYFSDGLSYAYNRLRTYAQIKNKPGFTGAKNLLKRLKHFVAYTDFTNPVLTYTGLHPDKPDDKQLSSSLDEYAGMDITSFFG